MTTLISDLVDVLYNHGIINYNQKVHAEIKTDFERLRNGKKSEDEIKFLSDEFKLSEDSLKRVTVEKAEQILSEKYCLDPSTIHGIIYRKKNKV